MFSLINSYGAIAQIQWHIPQGGEKFEAGRSPQKRNNVRSSPGLLK